MQGWQVENCVLYVVTALTIISAYYFGAGEHSWWALAFLLMVNSSKTNESKGDKSQESKEQTYTK